VAVFFGVVIRRDKCGADNEQTLDLFPFMREYCDLIANETTITREYFFSIIDHAF
jgi:hypothetical protein